MPSKTNVPPGICCKCGYYASGSVVERDGHWWHADCWIKELEETIESHAAQCDSGATGLAALRAVVHGHVQVIRGMCTDQLDHREIDRALVRLNDAINPPQEENR